jgi:hypothetical protein
MIVNVEGEWLPSAENKSDQYYKRKKTDNQILMNKNSMQTKQMNLDNTQIKMK